MGRAWWVLALLMLQGCESVEYGVKEQFGIEKRDILAARVNDAMSAQEDAKAQFQSALEEFTAVTGYRGGELESLYDDLSDAYDESAAKAATVSERIDDVERVSKALFGEWREELEQYTNASLRRSSEEKLKATETKYEALMTSMRRAESRMEPVLDAFRDQVLYLKHNLNAQAIAALKSELESLYDDLSDAYDESTAKAATVSDRIDDVERVSKALFSEWRDELEKYTNPTLRRSSEEKLKVTETKYRALMTSMRRAESRMEPVLDAFRDQVLYLKHNLNAQAIAALKSELAGIETDVARLIQEMEASIARSQAFVRDLEAT